jgi:hypothetical protein
VWWTASRDPRRADRVRPRRAVAAGALAVAAVAASPASADVLFDNQGGADPRERAPILASPEGALRQLADPGGAETDGFLSWVVSPDRRLLARESGTRTVLLPTGGGSPRVVGPGGLRPKASESLGGDSGGSYYVVIGDSGSAVWWDADGRHVLRDDVRTRAGTPAVVSCEPDSGRCTARAAPRGLLRVGTRLDGGSLWTGRTPLAVRRVLELGGGVGYRWSGATAAAVRRARAALGRPVTDTLVLASTDGTERELWRSRDSYATGTMSLSPSEGGEDGTIVVRSRIRYAVQTRRRGGRLQARLRYTETHEAPWRIDPQGRRTTFVPRSSDGDRLTSVGVRVPGRGWLGVAGSPHGRDVPVTVDADGTVRRILVNGRAATASAVHGALGLSPTPVPGFGFALPAGLSVAGYEAATDSAVVSYYDGTTAGGLRQVVARVPLAGGPPSLVVPPADASDDDPDLMQVTVW